jgi:hypothetical protein
MPISNLRQNVRKIKPSQGPYEVRLIIYKVINESIKGNGNIVFSYQDNATQINQNNVKIMQHEILHFVKLLRPKIVHYFHNSCENAGA